MNESFLFALLLLALGWFDSIAFWYNVIDHQPWDVTTTYTTNPKNSLTCVCIGSELVSDIRRCEVTSVTERIVKRTANWVLTNEMKY